MKTLITFLLLLISNFNCFSQIDQNLNKILTKEIILNNGTTVKISDLKGKVVLLDFWYRGCFPCLQATPELIKLQNEYKDQLVIIGINDRDDAEDITDYYTYKSANYLSSYKTDFNFSNYLKIKVFPTFIIINNKGNVVYNEIGFNKKEIRKQIKKYINIKNPKSFDLGSFLLFYCLSVFKPFVDNH